MATSKWWLRRNRIAVADAPVDAPAPDADGELLGLTKAELVSQAEARGLDTSGTKADLVERLNAPESDDPDATSSDAN